MSELPRGIALSVVVASSAFCLVLLSSAIAKYAEWTLFHGGVASCVSGCSYSSPFAALLRYPQLLHFFAGLDVNAVALLYVGSMTELTVFGFVLDRRLKQKQ